VKSSAPQIGFDRYIQFDWVAMAVKVRAGMVSRDELYAQLDEAGLSVAARKKTRTVLNRLWLEPRRELAEFSERGIQLFLKYRENSITALCWGMAIAAYPFFGKVAELIGRLSALQGDCTSAEVHRRMSEIYGEREGTKRMTNMVIQSQASWGALERVEGGKRLIRKTSFKIEHDDLVAWLTESVIRYSGRVLPVATLQSPFVLYPFILDRPLAYVVSSSAKLELRTEGASNQLVALSD